jgi:hypothetical protein
MVPVVPKLASCFIENGLLYKDIAMTCAKKGATTWCIYSFLIAGKPCGDGEMRRERCVWDMVVIDGSLTA